MAEANPFSISNLAIAQIDGAPRASQSDIDAVTALTLGLRLLESLTPVAFAALAGEIGVDSLMGALRGVDRAGDLIETLPGF